MEKQGPLSRQEYFQEYFSCFLSREALSNMKRLERFMSHRTMSQIMEALGDNLLDDLDAIAREAHGKYSRL